jgi:hypothetical protein
MNHRNEKYLLGRGINVFSVMLLLSLLTFSTSDLFSQNIISRESSDYPMGSFSSTCSTSPYNDCVITLPPTKYGESYSFTIPLKTGINRSDITFNFSQITSCNEGSISFTTDGKIEISALSSCRPEANNFISIDVNVVNNSDGSTDKQKFYLPVLRDPIKIVLVLDNSGSMSLPLIGGSGNHWQIVKNAVELFVQRLEVFKQEMDVVGITYFASDVSEPGNTIGKGFIPITSESDPNRSYLFVKADLSSKEPGSLSAIGKGVLGAKKKINEASQIDYKKCVLLISDGLQNVKPLINSDGKTLSHGNLTLNDCPCSNFDSIRYYTINLGSSSLYPEVFIQMANANGGVSLTTSVSGDEDEIMNAFQEQFSFLLGARYQIVSRETGILSSSETSYTYPINGNVSKLYFEFVNPDASGVTIKLEKDGKDLTSLANITSGSFYKTLSLSLPLSSSEGVDVQGLWKVTISGSSTKKYSLTGYVNDRYLGLSCKPNRFVNTVGDVLQLNAKLTFAGEPLKGDNKVEVAIVKPGDDLGSLLSTYKDSKSDTIPDVEQGAQTKFLHLVYNDKNFVKELFPKTQIIELTGDGSGNFEGQFKNTDLTGTYQLLYIVNGEIPGFGKFERQKQYSVIYKFGQLDPSATDIRASIAGDGKDRVATVTIKPKNKFGYYLGPGYLSQIRFSVDSRQGIVKSSKDNLDGSYSFTVVNLPQSIKPDVSIDVMGEQLYQGKFPTPKIHFWQYLVLILLILTLFLRYIFAHIGSIWLRTIAWTMIILWVLFMILQKLGVIIF